jgi:hypothetical protein
MLDPLSRGAIVALSTLFVAGMLALAPLGVRGSGEETPLPLGVPADAAAASNFVGSVAIRRDPFAEPAVATVSAAVAPARLPIGSQVRPLPSNLESDTIPTLPGGAVEVLAGIPRVTAIVTGTHPYAMLDTGGIHEIKGIGDRVGGIAIVSIDMAGVRLQNGERYAVDPGVGL